MKPGDKVWWFDARTQTIECGEAIPTRDDMIATTIEQSKKLLSAGYSILSADMCYQNYTWESDKNGDPKNITPVGGLTVGNLFMDYPAWSFGALWNLCKKFDLVFDTGKDSAEQMIETMVTKLISCRQ